MKLSFIGLGAMGLPMAKALLDASYDIEAFDISTGQMNAFRALGGKIATSARYTATGADVLLLMVLNAEQVETLLFEQDCLAALADNATIIVLSTVPPTYIQDLTRRLDTFSISLIDAPVSGGVLGAEEKRLSIMASGPKTAFEKVEPILNTMGSNVYYLSEENSHGSAMKMINQLLAGVHLATAAEAMNLAQTYGLDVLTVQDVMAQSAGHSWMLSDRGKRMLEPDPEVKSSINIWLKDLGIVKSVAGELDVNSPLTDTALKLFMEASKKGYGNEDDSQVIKVLKE